MTKSTGKRFRWAEEELGILQAQYPTMIARKLHELIPRHSERSIYFQARKMKLEKSPEILNSTRFKPGNKYQFGPGENGQDKIMNGKAGPSNLLPNWLKGTK